MRARERGSVERSGSETMSASDEDSDLGSTVSDEECTPHEDEKERNSNSDYARRASAPRLSMKTLPTRKKIQAN